MKLLVLVLCLVAFVSARPGSGDRKDRRGPGEKLLKMCAQLDENADDDKKEICEEFLELLEEKLEEAGSGHGPRKGGSGQRQKPENDERSMRRPKNGGSGDGKKEAVEELLKMCAQLDENADDDKKELCEEFLEHLEEKLEEAGSGHGPRKGGSGHGPRQGGSGRGPRKDDKRRGPRRDGSGQRQRPEQDERSMRRPKKDGSGDGGKEAFEELMKMCAQLDENADDDKKELCEEFLELLEEKLEEAGSGHGPRKGGSGQRQKPEQDERRLRGIRGGSGNGNRRRPRN